MREGIYKANILNYGITSTKDGLPQATINFKLSRDEEVETVDMMWSGSLKEGRAQEITIDALLICGYNENNLNLFSEGKGLDDQKTVIVTVVNEPYKGRDQYKIAWVNEVGSKTNKDFMASENAILKMSGLNISGLIMSRRAVLGKPINENSDLPF